MFTRESRGERRTAMTRGWGESAVLSGLVSSLAVALCVSAPRADAQERVARLTLEGPVMVRIFGFGPFCVVL